MKSKEDVLELFENLEIIEPSADWEEKFSGKLSLSHNIPGGMPAKAWVLLAVILLFTVNLISFSKSWQNDTALQKGKNLKNFASEFLINTNSSKY
jgi:hypothetical protein